MFGPYGGRLGSSRFLKDPGRHKPIRNLWEYLPVGGWVGGGGGCDALPLTRSNIKNLYPFKIRVKAKGEESNSREEGSGKLVSYPS